MKTKDQLLTIFRNRFGTEPGVFIAPGRINLIGEHTDYNEGFVMPAAIDHHITFLIAPNKTTTFNCYAADIDEYFSFEGNALRAGDSWVNYLMGVVKGIREHGFEAGGVDCVFGSTIPVGAGLSSSAALCCGFGMALNDFGKFGLSKLDLAKIGQYSEHNFAGVRCGIMDQYASVFGQSNSALLLDCKQLEHEVLPVSLGDYRIMLIDTKVKHSLASTAYNDRRASCEEGVKIISKKHPGVKSLRDVTRTMLDEHQDELGEEVYIKCVFVVEEISRTLRAAGYLKAGELTEFGTLLYETHWGLSQAYEVSCEELDFLVSLAEDQRESIPGARMMGGGFGGCTINLVHKSKVDYVRGYVHEKYFTTFKTEPEFYLVSLADGVHKE